jgi:ribose 1,5-bisphosphokinase PhnN
LRAGLGFPLVAKDALKERLGETLGVTERAESQRLGAAVFDVLALVVHELLAARVSTIAEGNLTLGSSLWRGLPPCRLCQVHVSAAPDVLRTRLRVREARHPVHYDREAADEIAARAARGEWGALELDGALVRIDTTQAFPDAAALVARATAALDRRRS